MSTTKYANAVGVIRAMENNLISGADIDRMIAARTKADADAVLTAKKGSSDLNTELSEVWDMLNEFAADCDELKILLYRNDFHNLKAVLKAIISNRDPSPYYVKPSNVELSALTEAFGNKEYGILPEYMRKTAEEAYELLTETLDGQLSDSLIDRACLEGMQKSAKKCGCEFMQRYAELTALCADIKTAYRCSLMKKSRQFIETAICGSDALEKEILVDAAFAGTDDVFAVLENSAYSDAASLLKESPAKFEKWCDDIIMELAESSRYTAFGVEPLAAYYIAKETEIKNLRILAVCRESGSDSHTITERMRKLYV